MHDADAPPKGDASAYSVLRTYDTAGQQVTLLPGASIRRNVIAGGRDVPLINHRGLNWRRGSGTLRRRGIYRRRHGDVP